MAKITKKELAKRKSEMTARARAEVAKTEIVQFRVDAEVIEKLYECSAEMKLPVGTMVRQWVIERLSLETAAEHNNIASINERLDRLEGMLKKVLRKNDVRAR